MNPRNDWDALMNPTNELGEQKVPLANYSHTLAAPGIPITALLSSVALLLGAYGIKHDIPIDPTFTTESMTTGDSKSDERFTANYMAFKSLLDGLAREFTTVNCLAQSNGWSVYMRFSCY